MKDRLAVIARYKEDLDWLKDLNNPFMVYNKGPEWPYEITRKDIPNKGREAETYFRSIIENYSTLSQYKYMVFLQGNPFEHCHDLFEKINTYDDENNIGYLSESNGVVELSKILYLKEFSVSLIECLLKQNYSAQSGAVKSLLFLNFIGIEVESCEWSFACGAQYIVPTKMILNKSVEWWMHVYRVFECYKSLGSDDFAYILEFTWPMIWNFSDNKKEDMS
jgi:hypothetical protein